MKTFISVLVVGIAVAVSVSFAEDADISRSSDPTPRITIPDAEYDFQTIMEGEDVVHTFVVKNTGSAPLKITNIKTTCGCTTSAYTRGEIPPGADGTVTLKLKTSGYGGRTVKKTATVSSNDPKTGDVKLQLSGKVEVLAEITPDRIKLMGAPGEKLRKVVEIVPSEAHPFHIVGEPQTGKDTYRCTLEERGGKYILTAENLATEVVSYFDEVVLKTDLSEHPEIRIRVVGIISHKTTPK